MGRHEAFPILDYSSGLDISKEPWLTPREAFSELRDAVIDRGRLLKRQGLTPFAELGDTTALIQQAAVLIDRVVIWPPGEPTNPIAGASQWTLDSGNYPVVSSAIWEMEDNGGVPGDSIFAEAAFSDSVRVLRTDTTTLRDFWVTQYSIFDQGGTEYIGFLELFDEPHDQQPYLNILGQAIVVWEAHPLWISGPSNLSQSLFSYYAKDRGAVTGLTRFETDQGVYSVAGSATQLYLYDAADAQYELLGPTLFSGDNEDYWWFWPFGSYLLCTNGVNSVTRLDPETGGNLTALSEQPTAWDPARPGVNILTTALLVVLFRGRVLYLNTTEEGQRHPRRCRYSDAGAYDQFATEFQFLDAPPGLGDIVTCDFIGERLFVGFERGWMELSRTGDVLAPFQWVPFISRFGAVSKLSTIRDNERLLSRSSTTMQAIDPNGQRFIDQKIPDLLRSFNPDNTHLCSGVRNEDENSFWWTVATAAAPTPNKVLNATYDEEGNLAWSLFEMEIYVFSTFEVQGVATWNSLGPNAWDFYTTTSWDDARIGAAGFTQLIAGGTEGTVYKVAPLPIDKYVLTDFRPIPFYAKTALLTPYPGRKAHLGFIDVYASANSKFSISLISDTQPNPYLLEDLDFSDLGTAVKGIRRIPVNRTASFHGIIISSDLPDEVQIDAIIPWFAPSGRLREVN
jgi:hypothetical protein